MDLAKAVRALSLEGFAAACTWPVFSVTSFVAVRSLRRQRVAPRTVIDVGANVGQFAVAATKLWRPSAVIALEPSGASFSALKQNTAGIGTIRCVRAAVGGEDGTATLNINRDSRSNSLLAPTHPNLDSFPGVERVSQEEVPMLTLESALRGTELEPPVLLKIDTQGSEMAVLQGAGSLLTQVDWILAELSLEAMYEGEATASAVIAWLHHMGWAVDALVDFLRDRHDRIVQIDVLLTKSDGFLDPHPRP